MTKYPFSRALLILAIAMPAAACNHAGGGDAGGEASSRAESPSFITHRVHEALDEARQELATKDLELGKLQVGSVHLRPLLFGAQARITPSGELVIGDKPVTVTPEQQRMLLAYRGEVIALTEAGMDIGEEASALGMDAAKLALGASFSGKSDTDIEAELKPRIERITAAAMQLCDRLPGLRSSQQALASTLPAFQPWATLQEKDIESCRKDALDD